jgi:WD40 repeat protein
VPPEYLPAPAAKLPAPADLAKLPAFADALKRQDIPEDLLKKAGGSDKALAELVAIFGEDKHARGAGGCQLATVAFSPDGKMLAFGGTGNKVRLIDLEAKPPREQTWNPRGPEADIASLAFSPDSKLLACARENGSILLWNVVTGTELPSLPSPDSRVARIAFSPDGTLLASAGQVNNGGAVRLWKVATGQLLFTSPRTPGLEMAWEVAFSPDGKTLAAGLDSGEVRLFDVASGWQVATLSGHGGPVRWLGFHPDGRSLAVAGTLTENAVFVWDLTTRKQPRRQAGHRSEVLTGAWRADGRLLITAGALDGTVRLWDPSSDRLPSKALAVIPPNSPWVRGIALSPEGRHLAVCNPNGTVYVLRMTAEKVADGKEADGKVPASFTNNTDDDFELFWLDTSKANEVSYGVVHKGATKDQQTYNGHVWVIRNPRGEELGRYTVKTTPDSVAAFGLTGPQADLLPKPGQDLAAIKAEMIRLTNVERAKAKLGGVVEDTGLSSAAQKYADRMAEKQTLSHKLDGTDPGQRVRAEKYNWKTVDEIIYRADQKEVANAAKVIQAWMRSEGDRDAILGSRYPHIGVGVAYSATGVPYYTVLFAQPMGDPQVP